MKDFLASLGSVYWWLSVVIIGLLINLSSAYLKSRLDALSSRRSTKRRAQMEAENAARKRAVASLRGRSDAQILLSTRATHDLIMGLTLLAVGALCIGFRTLLTVTPADSPTWWPISPPMASRIARIMQFLLSLSFAVCSLTALRAYNAYVYKIRVIADARQDEVNS